MGLYNKFRYAKMIRSSVYLLSNLTTRKKWAKNRDSDYVFHREWLPKAIFGRKPKKKRT